MNQKFNSIHPTAIIHPSVKMGYNNHIGPYVIIGENVIIGNDNYIGPQCIIGDTGESINFFNKPLMGVLIGNGNRMTKQVTIDSGTVNATIVKDNTLWLKNAHAGHDCLVENNSQLRCNAIIGGHVTMEEGSRIYLSAIVHPRLTLPKNCIIGMGAVVTKRTELYESGIYIGNPASLLRFNI
jgi:UDP-N-acetylglucosamine acyltransferase